ncbi:MAG: cobalt ECF transporter T component CbiQ [Filifactoraceae bacterium]
MLAIDSLAYKSKIAKVNPRAKLCFALIPLMVVLILGKPMVSLVCMIVMAITTLKLSKLNARSYLKLMIIPLGFLLMGTLTIMVGRHSLDSEILYGFRLGEYFYGVSKDSLKFGGSLVLRALACVSCMYFISLNTPMNQLFTVLRDFKIPTLIVSLMELIYRYIFVVLEEADRIFVAQSSRGIGKGFKAKLRAFGELVASLLQRSFSRSNRIVSSLEARGYDGNFYVLKEEYHSGKKLYTITLILFIVLMVLGFWR